MMLKRTFNTKRNRLFFNFCNSAVRNMLLDMFFMFRSLDFLFFGVYVTLCISLIAAWQ